jgi:hypothetical protein
MLIRRTRFIQDSSPNYCTIEYTYECGGKIRRDFGAPFNGGVVWEDHQKLRTVCEGLYSLGWVLLWDPKEDPTLSDLLRREHRRAMAAERRSRHKR